MTTDTATTQLDARVLPDVSHLLVGVLGGTGEQGRGLARRLAMSGQKVVIGSRDAGRAQGIADDIGFGVIGATNEDCAINADVVIVAVPWGGHAALLQELTAHLAGKIIIDCVNPLGFDKQGAYGLPVEEGSAAEQAAFILKDSHVVGAFHHLSAVLLLDESVASIETDVLVVGDDRNATDTVQALASRIPGIRGVFAGRLRNCGQIETFTANLISINRRYKAHSGIRVTDI